MRVLATIAIAVALVACGQPAVSNGDAAAQAPGAGDGQAAYVEACVARYVAQSAQARQWAPNQCVEDWRRVVASAPLAEAILAAAAGRPPTGNRLGDLAVTVDRNARTSTWSWSETGGLIPYDAIGALEQRGAAARMIGCSQLGAGEFTKVYAVTPAGGSAFQLSIYERSAPTANAESFYNVIAHAAGRVQTRAELARDGSEWTEACAY